MSQNLKPPSSWRWPILVIGLLIGHAALMLVAVLIATSDRSFTVLPNYYKQALAWDANQAIQRQSEKLGWTIDTQTAATADPLGQRQVRLTLRDAAGRLIPNGTLELSYYHRTSAGDVQRARLNSTGPGLFEQKLPLRKSGFWEFRIEAIADGQRFVTTTPHFVEAGR